MVILRQRLALLVMMALSLSAGCGDSEDEDDDENSADATASALVGNWSTGCQAQDSNGLTESYTFTSTSGEATIQFYEDTGCATSALRFRLTFDYAISDSSVEGASNFDLTITKAYERLDTQATVDYANSVSAFGKTDWTVGTEVDITGKKPSADSTDDQVINAGDVAYDLVQRNNDQLCFGDTSGDNSGNTAATRPTQIDTADCIPLVASGLVARMKRNIRGHTGGFGG